LGERRHGKIGDDATTAAAVVTAAKKLVEEVRVQDGWVGAGADMLSLGGLEGWEGREGVKKMI